MVMRPFLWREHYATDALRVRFVQSVGAVPPSESRFVIRSLCNGPIPMTRSGKVKRLAGAVPAIDVGPSSPFKGLVW
jgi:hypothetical protein